MGFFGAKRQTPSTALGAARPTSKVLGALTPGTLAQTAGGRLCATFIAPISPLEKLRLREIKELTREAGGRNGAGTQAA